MTTATASPIPTSSIQSDICGPNSLSDGKCGWVSGPSVRSTYSILWSCCAIILLCTYKVVHVNICKEVEHKATWKEWHFYRKRLRKFWYMIGCVVGPEVIAAIAFIDRSRARKTKVEVERTGHRYSMLQAHFIVMGGLYHESLGVPSILRFDSLLKLIENGSDIDGLISQLPPDQDIADRDQKDTFTIILACVQSLWLLVQCIARKATGAEISELELSTCGFVLISLISYTIWWDKPYDIKGRTLIHLSQLMQGDAILSVLESDNPVHFEIDRVELIDIAASDNPITSTVTVLSLGMLLSVIHLAAWNWSFPTNAELWVWRISNLVPLFLCCIMAGLRFNFLGRVPEDIQDILIAVFSILYTISRTIVIIQIFLCFRAMPQGVYRELPWVQLIPHFS